MKIIVDEIFFYGNFFGLAEVLTGKISDRFYTSFSYNLLFTLPEAAWERGEGRHIFFLTLSK